MNSVVVTVTKVSETRPTYRRRAYFYHCAAGDAHDKAVMGEGTVMHNHLADVHTLTADGAAEAILARARRRWQSQVGQ